jgi:hypothetical protein
MCPLLPEVDRFKQRFGVGVYSVYGMTEIGSPIRVALDDATSDRAGCCGRAISTASKPGWWTLSTTRFSKANPVSSSSEAAIPGVSPAAISARRRRPRIVGVDALANPLFVS